MPVQSHQIPLDTAKAWAKRLTKTSKTITPHAPWKLSQGQLAIAQMLGFQDWHALEQGLVQPTVSEAPSVEHILPNPFQHQGPLPENRQQWQEFWRHIMSKSDDVHFESRDQGTVRVRMRVRGKLFVLLTLNRESGQAEQALEALFEGAEHNPIPGLFSNQGFSNIYVSGLLPNRAKDGDVCRYQMLPVYPGGWDLVVGITKNVHNLLSKLQDLNLPVNVAQTLRRIGRKDTGVLLFTGRIGTGRSTLMKALSYQVYSDVLLTTAEANHEELPVDELPGVNGQMPIGDRAKRPIRIHWATQETLKNPERFQELFSQKNFDLVILDALQDANGGRLIESTLAKGRAIWAGMTSSGGPYSVMGRLKDFLPNWDEDHPHGLNGWTHGNLLQLLCPHCSVPAGWDGERGEGPGCGHCSMTGLIGQQLVLDVWEVHQGKFRQLESALEQARDLIASGKVARSEAVRKLGPLSR